MVQQMENLKIVFDSDIVIDLLRGRKREQEVFEHLLTKNFCFLTSVSFFEIAHGAYHLKRLKEIDYIQRVFAVLDFDTPAALIAGRVRSELQKKGITVPAYDLLIGAICLNHNLPLLTGNIKHFVKIPELTVMNFESVKNELQKD